MERTMAQSPLRGTVAATGSKSMAHRLLICQFLSGKTPDLDCKTTSLDIFATKTCLTALASGGLLPCGESGSTLLFLLPVAAALGRGATFRMEGRLPDRPLAPLLEQLEAHGVTVTRPTRELLRIEGALTPGHFTLPGNISSQFISGLLLALPLLPGPSTLEVTGPVESAPYIDLTLAALAKFGVRPDRACGTFRVAPAPYRCPPALTVEGDWSNAAFWLCAGALGGPVSVTGLDRGSLQGDKAILDILARFGAHLEEKDGVITVSGGTLRGIDMDASQVPDLVPAVSIVAAAAAGPTRITGARRLRLKESDRLTATAALVRALGGDVEEQADGLVIRGGGLTGGVVDPHGDHRIAMAAAMALPLCPVALTASRCTDKSDTHFWQTLQTLL